MSKARIHYSLSMDPRTAKAICGDADYLRYAAWLPIVSCRRCLLLVAAPLPQEPDHD